jgi:hypothetical protein
MVAVVVVMLDGMEVEVRTERQARLEMEPLARRMARVILRQHCILGPVAEWETRRPAVMEAALLRS